MLLWQTITQHYLNFMELIKATDIHTKAFEQLEREFIQYDNCLGIDAHYKKVDASTLPPEYFASEMHKRLNKQDVFFYLAQEDDTVRGYIYGYIEALPDRFERKQIGYLDSIFLSESFRGKGHASAMKEAFFTWLAEHHVTLCQIHVAAPNTNTLEVYKKWGFTPDQIRLTAEVPTLE